MLGDGEAVGFRFGKAIRGRWVWELKDMIDGGFMKLFDVDEILKSEGEGGSGDGGKDYDEHEDEKERGARIEIEGMEAAEAATQLRTEVEADVLKNWMILKRLMREEGSNWFDSVMAVYDGHER